MQRKPSSLSRGLQDSDMPWQIEERRPGRHLCLPGAIGDQVSGREDGGKAPRFARDAAIIAAASNLWVHNPKSLGLRQHVQDDR